MNHLQAIYRLLAAGILTIASSTLVLSAANAGSSTKPPTVKPTESTSTPTGTTNQTSGTPAGTPKVEADCATETIQGSATNPTIGSSNTSTTSPASSSLNSANAGRTTKLAGVQTTSQNSQRPTASKPCPSNLGETGASPSSGLNTPSMAPSDTPAKPSDAVPGGASIPTIPDAPAPTK